MALFIISLLFVNMMFFFLIGIGGVSMASVEGVVSPWLHRLYPFWIIAHIPYAFYVINLIRNRKNENSLIAIKRSISFSAWLAFPGGIAIFMFFGSKIPWVVVIIPLIQTTIAIFVYIRNK